MSAQSKHFLNDPATLVLDSLQGLCAVNPQLVLDSHNKSVFVANPDRSKVALLCGGGSGHEPAHAGFVGKGILTGAICGNIFASPNASQVRRAIDFVDNEKGTVIIVKNYTGDVLNFGLAKEQYAALHPTKADKVKFLIVGDDVAVGRTQGSIVGRRGLAGTVLVYKVAGALADTGASLDEVYNLANWVASNIVTIGVGLEHCHVPGTVPALSHLESHEIEIGMGIHNESGYRRESPVPKLGELIPQLNTLLTAQDDPERSFLQFERGDNVVVLVNNLGGVSELELGAIVGEVTKDISQRGFGIKRILSGTFMTSLNMSGFSITLLRLPSEDTVGDVVSREIILSLLDAKPEVPGWKWSAGTAPAALSTTTPTQVTNISQDSHLALSAGQIDFVARIQRACNALIDAEPDITRMDNIAGDGDCGLTLKTGAEGVLQQISQGKISGNDVVGSIIAISKVAEEAMGGTSGALYSSVHSNSSSMIIDDPSSLSIHPPSRIFFSALAQGLQSQSLSSGTAITPSIWTSALQSALKGLYTYTRARPPSRTLVDPLDAFINTLLNSNGNNYESAVKVAEEAAEGTKNLKAKAGRSAYVEGDRLREQQVPDPGAWGVKTILRGLLAE
ncbi:dihydroxyacetone kinase 1 [Pluteus cervinus]|uniref:Dihydroxyacetone kinase 1 n=1 Tax=Pluteus cervinus TaxID=181527 RepID=A0ACD3BB29_9AGAR|nr:dihydroxyacetone kinase 1 [Pluteus cervinus]